MHECDFQFFRPVGADIVERCFDLAWVWKWDPARALSLRFDEVLLYERQTTRILDELARQQR